LCFTRFRPIVVGPFNKKTSEDGKAQTAKYLGILDQYLADKTFLVGQRITYADILTAAIVQRGCDHVS
jgi:elongation factor 1-gamma